MVRRNIIWLVLLFLSATAEAQQAVSIRVDASVPQGAFKPVWAYFGHDEPNYTYLPFGKALLSELAASSSSAVHDRAHNLLTTGDGTPALKWGSTNAYTEDASGHPVYDWTILDRIFDAYRAEGITPLVEIGFMPKALSTHPEPYQHNFPHGSIFTGWSYPPKDYGKWAELVRQWVLHSVERYGRADVETWEWEVWNEPDIPYWHGTPEEYFKLYDYTADAVKRALPEARVGGPATTGPASPRAALFLKSFLEHCARGKNEATGKSGAPLDFISFHAKGRAQFVDGHVQMGLRNHLASIAKGFEIVAGFPEFQKLPIVLSESDPEGCAGCAVETHPEDGYRNSPQYASYYAAVLRDALALADRYHVNLQGVLTWAFEFEDQPYFPGLRAVAARGVDLPVMNVFRMLGLMDGERIQAESSAALSLDTALSSGAVSAPDIGALATRGDREVSILVWNYQDAAVGVSPSPIELTAEGILSPAHRVLLRHFRIDQDTSNAFTAWQQMGSPQNPSPEQLERLKSAGQLQLETSPQWLKTSGSGIKLQFALPSQAVSLIQLSW